METMIKENNIKITTTINGNFNDKLNDFQTTLTKTCEDMNTQQMSIINFNMINIIKVTLEEQRVTSQLSPSSNHQQDINQQPNIIQFISLSTPLNTRPISPQLMESQLPSTESSLNERQPNSKHKQTDPSDSEEVVSTTDKIDNQDMVMKDQEISNSTQTRTSARPSTPATRDNKKKNQLSSKKTRSRLGKTRKLS